MKTAGDFSLSRVCVCRNCRRTGWRLLQRIHIELFNGRDFSGWTFCMKNNADPMQTWSVTNGVIHCTGKPVGYLRTKQSYSNYVLTVEWRFVKIAPKADNSGVLVHIQLPDKVWPHVHPKSGPVRASRRFVFDGRRGKQGTQRHGRKHAGSPARRLE